MKKPLLFALAILPVLVLAGTTEHTIDQKDKAFSKTEITIKPGESIVFKNEDSVTHNVFSNSKNNAFNIKTQAPGNSSTVTFAEEGVTEVRCAIHPKMKLTVTIKK
jgi:plastocyanin